ncbi:MAG: glycosyl hydrolase family 28-related protein [Pseudomonadota bacterium]
MTIEITDGITLMPTPFEQGLQNFSSENGRPGDATYNGAANAVLVAGDNDFGTCAEFHKTETTQKIRYVGETPILQGTYLRFTARVKAVGGPRPSARISCYPGASNGSKVNDVTFKTDNVFLENYNVPYELSVIIGVGNRPGVDFAWGTEPVFTHVGIELTGDTNGFVRVDDFVVEDVTSIFHTKLISRVDVRDFGALGDGVTDDTIAFVTADAHAAALGKELLISDGEYYIASDLTLDARCQFEGMIAHSSPAIIAFTRSYNLNTYIDAFKDEQEALTRALGALFNYTDHESLDLCGRRIGLTAPIDVHAAAKNVTTFAVRRVIRNGLIESRSSAAWDDDVVTAEASYSGSNTSKLTGIANASAIPVGARITGTGVGREVYVKAVDPAAGTITLSKPLYGAPASQTYTFTRHKFMLDFSGFQRLSRLVFSEIEFLGGRNASAIMLAPDGIACHVHDCWFVRPKDKGITSIGTGCNGMTIESNEFIAPDDTEPVADRASICFNTNNNDMKIRNNRALRWRHFGVMAGGGHLILGNHFFQGDETGTNADRTAGLVLTQGSSKTTISGNYIDNAWIELNNEHDATPSTGSSFGKLTITGNIFTCSDVSLDFTYIRLAPHAANLAVEGLSVTDNAFKTIGGDVIQRIESIDTSRGSIDLSTLRNITFTGNSYEEILFRTESPLVADHVQVSEASSWTVGHGNRLPFGARVLSAHGVTPIGAVRDANNTTVYALPWAELEAGSGGSALKLHWSKAVRGRVMITLRCDTAH